MIVVTGGAGFIGSVLAWQLNAAGRRDLLLVDQRAEHSPKWANVAPRAFEAYVESDVFLDRLERGAWNGRLDAIFHMGACTDTTARDADYLRRNNSEYSERVARWALDHKVYCAYASSAAVYGHGELGFSDDDALASRLTPLNPYGQSKLDFDRWVLRHGYTDRLVGFRFFNVYGPNEYHKGEMRSMAHKGFEQVMTTGALRLFKSYRQDYPDGGQQRDFVYVKDIVEAMLWFHRHPGRAGIYNLGSGKARSWNALAEALFAACGKPARIDYIEMPDAIKPQYQYFTEADLRKLQAAGGPPPRYSLEQGVEDYVQRHLLTTSRGV
ncbi:MAG: ADP-glyceromanno-heptose 6-epimerase [Candidatus Omnitrophica bacterium]|nr:ADP-glyceromanno-heptose 6-epimerase [Candidatus Omnitrophota bacterium]